MTVANMTTGLWWQPSVILVLKVNEMSAWLWTPPHFPLGGLRLRKLTQRHSVITFFIFHKTLHVMQIGSLSLSNYIMLEKLMPWRPGKTAIHLPPRVIQTEASNQCPYWFGNIAASLKFLQQWLVHTQWTSLQITEEKRDAWWQIEDLYGFIFRPYLCKC